MEIKFFDELSEEQVKFIAESNYNYWKKFNSLLDYAQSTGNIISMRNNIGNLPKGIALIDNGNIAGFCTLRMNRLINHLDKNPWLCNLMIFDGFKGKGLARILVNSACQKFKELGYDKIYVWTDQAPQFYKKIGWKYEGKIIKNEGGEGDLFSKEI